MKSLAIITGASRGIGLATALRFRAAGWDVAGLSRTPCSAPGVKHYPCDVSDASQIRQALGKLDLEPYGKVCLVHNAAAFPKDTYATLSEQEFMKALQVNVIAPQIINQRLLPLMPEGSSVIFIGSTLSERGTENRLSYVTSKHALAGLMKATCHDLAGKGIHACLVCPGYTDTQMLREGLQENDLARITGSVLAKRLIAPEEIAELVFFCSMNPAINGSVIHANLGQK